MFDPTKSHGPPSREQLILNSIREYYPTLQPQSSLPFLHPEPDMPSRCHRLAELYKQEN